MLARILPDGEASPPMPRSLVLISLAAVALACAWLAKAPLPPRATALAWRACAGDFQCASLRVPVDHRARAGATLELQVARLPAERPEARIGVLLVNPGGPGISAVAYLRVRGASFDERVRARFDLVAFDTRGTGGSTPLDCHESFARFMEQDPAPSDDAQWQAAVAASRAFATECAEKHAGLLPFMSSADSARDLDWVRAALGEERISYLGYSYGTALGASYATLYPERVRALVLDGAIDPEFDLVRFTREQAVAVEAALTAYDVAAKQKGWNGSETLDEVYARAPRKSTVLYAAAEGLTAPPESWRDLAGALGQAQTGDSSGLESLYQRYFGERSDGTRELSVEAQLATLCADLHRPASADAYRAALPEVTAASRHFGPGNLLSHLPCAFWPAPETGPLDPPGARLDAPILVIANRDDPLTPHVWGERLAARFPSATRVDVDSRMHTAFGRGEACLDSLVEQYLVDPAPPARSHCP
jgi:pimeloyl-ACP methyl ester carboxylesterase